MSTAALIDLPFDISSLILVNIITFESTAIPIERIIPAIPGSVRTAPSEAIATNTIRTYSDRARSAINPSSPYATSIIKKTIARPMIPALTDLTSAFAPIVAVSTDELTSVRDAGSAPPLMRDDVCEASSFEKPPCLVISQLLLFITLFAVGAEITLLSSIMMIDCASKALPSEFFSVAVTAP